MTDAAIFLHDEKMRADMINLAALTAKLNKETKWKYGYVKASD